MCCASDLTAMFRVSGLFGQAGDAVLNNVHGPEVQEDVGDGDGDGEDDTEWEDVEGEEDDDVEEEEGGDENKDEEGEGEDELIDVRSGDAQFPLKDKVNFASSSRTAPHLRRDFVGLNTSGRDSRRVQVLSRAQLERLLQAIPGRLGIRPQDRHEGRVCVGMVGYPNVGKSSVINTLLAVSHSTHGV